jgi:hypothetical protein
LQRIPPLAHAHLPPWHVVPPPHWRLQPPQLELSVCSLTHPFPHAFRPAGQVHTPPVHIWPPRQRCPHNPQLRRSLLVSTQAPPHDCCPAMGHTQPALTQLVPPGHALPQTPQFTRSVVVSTHARLQFVSVAAHVSEHIPLEQTSWVPPGGSGMAAQLFPQVPQLAGFDATLTHWPLHSVWPGGHRHAPLMHCSPPKQALPHAPQLLPSLVRSTHAPRQSVSGGPASVAQDSAHDPFKQTACARHAIPQPPQLA